MHFVILPKPNVSLYSPYYAEACNESPRHCVKSTQLHVQTLNRWRSVCYAV